MRAFLVAMMAVLGGCGGAPARQPGSCDGPCPASKVNHLVVIVQENHTFDSYFGRYCTAPTGSQPTCTSGPGCCEAAPTQDPSGAMPIVLDDTANAAFDPNHTEACELDEIDGGKMDRFVSSTTCGDKRNFALADATTMQSYWQLAQEGALADHWFQPLVGASIANDIYLARAAFAFKDNDFEPDAPGKQCSFIQTTKTFSDPTIADLLLAHGNSIGWYGEGYQAMLDARAQNACPDPPDGCGFGLPLYPCVYDPSDVPFQYFPSVRDNPGFMRDYTQLALDLQNGALPQVSFVKALGYRTEHPGYHNKITDGVAFVNEVLTAVKASAYAPDTLVLVIYDEGGGYFDHVSPPPASTADGKPLGMRVPALALGALANKGSISHVSLEHSSIVKFIEWNWLGMQVGQLGTRDVMVNNLGSLLDPAAAGVPVPSGQ
jgi:phospholipase C